MAPYTVLCRQPMERASVTLGWCQDPHGPQRQGTRHPSTDLGMLPPSCLRALQARLAGRDNFFLLGELGPRSLFSVTWFPSWQIVLFMLLVSERHGGNVNDEEDDYRSPTTPVPGVLLCL
eukprot:1108893-Amphidinium_carterae.1